MARDETVLDALTDLPPPRGQHHHFSHVALAEAARSDPEGFVSRLAGPEGEEFLGEMWNRCRAAFPSSEDRTSPEGLAGSGAQLACGLSAAVVKLPRAERIFEAYMAAVVLLPAERRLGIFKRPPRVRCFLLELGCNDDRSERTVLCELEFGRGDERRRVSYGDGPPPEKEAFLAAVDEKVGAPGSR